MNKLISVGLSAFLTFKLAIFIMIGTSCLIESVILPSKVSVILSLIFGFLGIIAFFSATLRISEKIIFRIKNKADCH